MEVYCGIPVIDLSTTLDEKEVGDNLVSALADVGFVYVKNQEISQQQVSEIFAYARRFFDLPLNSKMQYRMPTAENQPAHGFVPPEDECFDDDKPMDIKEALDLVTSVDSSLWPSDELVPNFRATVLMFIERLQALAYQLLHLVGVGLKLQDPEWFAKLCATGDDMQFRMVDYPRVSDVKGIEPGQLRCSEHTDYGGLTILFQDDCGGLQVRNRDGAFIDAVPLEGTALINIGDFLAMCTGGKLRSTPHRVLISEKNFNKRRQSLVYFCDPDGDKLLQPALPISGDIDEPAPISYNMWRNQRFKDTHMIP